MQFIKLFISILYIFLWLFGGKVFGQYFGKNKVAYKEFDFKILSSPHFNLYHYTDDSVARMWLGKAEKWHNLHSRVLRDTLKKKNPLIIYENHADFQQTTVFDFTINVGTGGITEGLKNRVVMPLTEHHWQTNHVLGHELVHAFQYNMLKTIDSLSLRSTENLPLWMVEGMAEFLSLGRNDPITSLWMRDAILYHYFPSIAQLRNPKYFPYRYGQSFWAFVSGVWGDEVIRPLFIETGKYGFDAACLRVLGYDMETISHMWRETHKNYYQPLMKNRDKNQLVGKILLGPKEIRQTNITPSVSPNGKKIVFLSRRDAITMSYYLYDIQRKKMIRRFNRIIYSSHIDFGNSYESAPAWSPDSRFFALLVFKKGRNALLIVDAEKGAIHDEFLPEDIGSISFPTWSPDGKKIVFTGLVKGISNLYELDLEKKSWSPITQDVYANIQPHWSPDGSRIVFASNRHPQGLFQLVIWSSETKKITPLPVLQEAENLNPLFLDNQTLIFLSDQNGFRDLYTYDIPRQKVLRRSAYPTGITGISKYSQSLSVSAKTGKIYYNLYRNAEYMLIEAHTSELLEIDISEEKTDRSAGCLPPKIYVKQEGVTEVVDKFLEEEEESIYEKEIEAVPYHPKFSLENLGSIGLGVGASQFGAGASGSVNAIFSDIVKNHTVSSFLAVNGEIQDIGGGLAYVFKKQRIDWGLSFSHIPYLSSFFSLSQETIDIQNIKLETTNYKTDILRTFEDRLGLFALFPMSRFKRWEAFASSAYYFYRHDRFNEYYHNFILVDRRRERLPTQDPNFLHNVGIAHVGDKSFNGIVGPLDGYRYRIHGSQYFGQFSFQEIIADLRIYRWFKPVGLAFRILHQGRYGPQSENSFLFPYNIGFPWFMRGYNYLGARNGGSSNRLHVINLIGSRMGLSNFEIRIPFTGPKNLSLIPIGYVGTELCFFIDAGIVWSSQDYKKELFQIEEAVNLKHEPVYSSGISLRSNLLGAFILEPFYAYPFDRSGFSPGTWGLNFLFPAW
ncbi:MAG: tolB protein precursor [Cytophagales bacterium]|nr:tolB protein precursor [Cytophagales bacterium]